MTLAPPGPGRVAAPPASATRRRSDRWGAWLTVVVPALLTYVPLLLTQPGWVGADTKTYLYLDPGKVLTEAPYVWNSQIGMGTVTHQYIGYLWPMGPWYWVFAHLGVPDWIAQRLWIGTVMLAAGLGVRYLCRTLGWGREWGGILVASLAYMFSPYLLEYSARISVILLPWAALPWLIALTAKSLRRGGWRYPALFALAVMTVGGINATALIMIGTGPLLYVAWAVWVDHEVSGREALAAVGRIGVLTVATSLWWIAGLWAEGKYGLPVTRYTETYKTVAEVSSPTEVLRGLGYWFFYGVDKLGPWTEPSATYTTNIPALALSYVVPMVAIVAAALVRWRYRALLLAILVVGALTSVASFPWSNPSAFGALFKAFTRTDAGLALRSTPRAAPLVVLALALFLGAGVTAVGRALPRLAVPTIALASLVIVANLSTLWTGQMVAQNLRRPEQIPQYEKQAASYLQSQGDATRVLEVPGSDFASYRWGNTVDPVTPGLMTRGYTAHELFQYGSAQSAALLDAFDSRFAEDDMDPRSIAPIARLMAAGDVVDRSDLQYERFRTARPLAVWQMLTATPGLATPKGFGTPTANVAGPQQPMIDEITLDTKPGQPNPPPMASFAVPGTASIVRTQPGRRSVLMAGDADGLVDSAALGLLSGNQANFLTGTFGADAANGGATFAKIYGADADLVVTDTNRKRAERWGTTREQTGYTERADETVPYDPTDQRLEVFPDETTLDQTVTVQRGDALVTASDYGNPVTYTPDDRAANAMDGDPTSAWRVGALTDPSGQHLDIALKSPTTADHLTLLQPIELIRNRWITKAQLTFDSGPPVVVDLNDSSRQLPGQTVTFPKRTFRHVQIKVLSTNIPKRPEYNGLSGVGLAEVTIPGVAPVTEVVQPPTDLLRWAGASSLSHRLSEVFTRLRSNPAEPVRLDEEPSMIRALDLPTARRFSLTGTAALSDFVPDSTTDALVGLPDAAHGGITASSSDHLNGALDQRASAAIDGNPATFWSAQFNHPTGSWVQYDLGHQVTLDHLDPLLVADGRHSVPTQLTIEPDGDAARAVVVDLPAVPDGTTPNATAAAPVTLPKPLTGQTFRFTVTGTRVVKEKDWYSDTFSPAPVAIAEIGIPGVKMPAPPARFDSGCRSDLLTLDGRPVPIEVTGSTADAVARKLLTVAPCGASTALSVGAGDHVLRTAEGRLLGIDVDQLGLFSDPGGAPRPLAGAGVAPTNLPAPKVTSTAGRVSYDIDIAPSAKPFWLAVDQSWSTGWHATVNGKALPPPTLINGYGNGWLIDPAHYAKGPLHAHVEWTPQRTVWIALGLSVIGLVVAIALVIFSRRRRAARVLAERPDGPTLPAITHPWGAAGTPLRWRTAIITGLALAGFVALTTPLHGWALPLMVLAIGGLTVASLRSARGRGVLGLLGAGALGVAALYIVQAQWRHHNPADFQWPLQYQKVSVLGLATVFLLAAEAVRELLARRAADREDPT